MAHLNDDIDESFLEKPCRFCLELYPEIVLLDHQAICEALIERVSYGGELTSRIPNATAKGDEANLSANLNDDNADDLFVEIACQICGELFPTLVMLEHQAICEVLHLASEEQFRAEADFQRRNSNISDADNPEIERKEEVKFKNANVPKVEISTEAKAKETNKSKTEEASKAKEVKVWPEKESNPLQKTGKSFKNAERSPQRNVKTEKIEKTFMPFGMDSENIKSFENEKQSSSKMPNNPLLEYADQVDDKEDIKNLSDDDCEESLEDFWLRAREYLKRQKCQNV